MRRQFALPRRTGRSRTSHERSERALKIAGAALGAVAIVGLSWMFLYPHLYPKPRIDQVTYCRETEPDPYTAILIDATDPINGIQKIAIKNELARVRAQIPRFGALAIYSMSFKGEVNTPEFFLCNPGKTEEIDWLTEGKLLAEKRWQEGFQRPLDKILDIALSAPSEQKSPLLEAIQSISVQSFGPLRAKGSKAAKRLIIISDMLQNSNTVNVYKRIPPPAQFLASPEYRKIRADLSDVEVAIYFVRSQGNPSVQRPQLMQFWQEILAAEGAKLVHFKPLEG